MTRRHLLDAAAIVFARDGFHGATLDAVAAAAGFTKGAVYSNWRSKDDLFLALLQDRMDRQLAVVSEVLESAGTERGDVATRVARLLESGVFFWDEGWSALYLEFVVYARRNPEAQAKLADAARRSRAFVAELIDHTRVADDRPARYATRELAEMSLALFEGLALARLIEPDVVQDRIIDAAIAMLGDATDARAAGG